MIILSIIIFNKNTQWLLSIIWILSKQFFLQLIIIKYDRLNNTEFLFLLAFFLHMFSIDVESPNRIEISRFVLNLLNFYWNALPIVNLYSLKM